MSEKRRWAVRAGGVPLTQLQWAIVVVVLLAALAGAVTFVILGQIGWLGLVLGLAGLVLVGVVLSGIGARNDRRTKGEQ